MGQQTSKEELLYQQVSYGNVEGIKLIHSEGGGLEWLDREGKTPLIVACTKPDLFDVAKTLIELGANVNAYRPGTPLHHAAARGLEQTVKLLLSYGANALVMNDDWQTPLDVARAKGHPNVVRVIESRICLFSGWLRELNGPGFLKAFVPQWVSQKVWAVVIPRDSRNPSNPQKFELAVYPDPQAQREEHVGRPSGGRCRRRRRRRRRENQIAQPHTVIKLWKANIEEPDFNQSDPSLVIVDKANKSRFKFLSANEGDKQQLEWFYDACRGMQQLNIPATETISAPEDAEYTMNFSGSQSATEESLLSFPSDSVSKTSHPNGLGNSMDNAGQIGLVPPDGPPTSKISGSGWLDEPSTSSTYNGWGVPEVVGPSENPDQNHQSQLSTPITVSIQNNPPSAPPIPGESSDDGPIVYPTIDSSPVDVSMPTVEMRPAPSKLKEDGDASASCVICLDAPKEGACVPCGHVVGCMSCLNDIKEKGWGCPLCRAKIDQVVKLYHA
ncbi:putative E3 ubiquitin-protein ligase XBAT35 isoform X2 [Magnolia sinica]|uniref:putative E3 ubiquitin-protein ligase XBAT35 isoform X2 n=1 Tax=Magnolia sinica TaxID=86752 RepID=UPI002658DE03|nr:putative E3 ubiquitin-protein ligase XBAT35 isoform X2 [Magnolia sinica]